MTLAFLLGAVAALGAAAYVWSRALRPEAPAALSWRCPHCDKKVRYPPAWAGRDAGCPGCKRRLTLPDSPSAAPGAGTPGGGIRVRRKPGPCPR
jgi:hypothetical protein